MKNCLSGLGTALFLSLTLAAPAKADACSYRMGPFLSQDAAQAAAQQARYLGFEASGVWGQGGLYSDWSNRRYFFNVFYSAERFRGRSTRPARAPNPRLPRRFRPFCAPPTGAFCPRSRRMPHFDGKMGGKTRFRA
jgi:hypothetical protein